MGYLSLHERTSKPRVCRWQWLNGFIENSLMMSGYQWSDGKHVHACGAVEIALREGKSLWVWTVCGEDVPAAQSRHHSAEITCPACASIVGRNPTPASPQATERYLKIPIDFIRYRLPQVIQRIMGRSGGRSIAEK